MSAADAALVTPPCPPSEVRDQILTWDEVQPGDLVLWDGELRLVLSSVPADAYDRPGQRCVVIDGEPAETIPCGTYSAVRRYDTAPAIAEAASRIPHPRVTWVNAIGSESVSRCYPDADAAFRAASDPTREIWNNTRLSLGYCTDAHEAGDGPR